MMCENFIFLVWFPKEKNRLTRQNILRKLQVFSSHSAVG